MVVRRLVVPRVGCRPAGRAAWRLGNAPRLPRHRSTLMFRHAGVDFENLDEDRASDRCTIPAGCRTQ